ncbi:Vacuolar protease A [Phlyctochytrium bullatum]|nr:Vacuolar protease A [Phlyctochytrium bullatum]
MQISGAIMMAFAASQSNLNLTDSAAELAAAAPSPVPAAAAPVAVVPPSAGALLGGAVALTIKREQPFNLAMASTGVVFRAASLRFGSFDPLKPRAGGVTDMREDQMLRRRAASLGLVNNLNLFYATQVTLGNGQTMKVHVDTGSADTWFRGPNCISTDRSCVGPRVDVSDTARIAPAGRAFRVAYGSGMVEGNVYSTSLTAAGLTANPVYVGVSTREEGFDDQGYTDGLLGLAYDAVSGIKRALGSAEGAGQTNFFDQLKFPAGSRRFGVYLSNSRDGDQGELVLGGDNPAKYTGPKSCLPLVQNSFWAFSLQGSSWKISDSTGPLGGTLNYAIADTGTSLAVLDDEVARRINVALGGRLERRYNVYIVDCKLRQGGGPDVVFTIGGKEFVIPPEIYVLEDPLGACVSGFAPGASGGSIAILGDTFLRAYYSIYDKDNSQVCFAKAVHG